MSTPTPLLPAGPAAPGGGPSPLWLAVTAGLLMGGMAWWWFDGAGADGAPPVDPAPMAATANATASATATATATGADGPGAGMIVPAPAHAPGAARPGAASATAVAPVASTTATAPRIARVRAAGEDQTPDLRDHVNDGEAPTMAEVIDRLHQQGVTTGLGAFNPPGTRPPLIGLVAPEGLVLPPGYVRHYQATDDGQRIEPILMFSPDQPVLDANGRPVAVPADRVVPPELAPPGLSLRRVVIPAPRSR